MKDEKNTDRIIREKLEGFSATPPPHIWDNVRGQLIAQKRRTRRIYIGWISTAAVIVLAFLGGWYFNGNSKIEKNTSVSNEIIQPEKSISEIVKRPIEMASQNTDEQKATYNSKEIRNSETAARIKFSPVASKRIINETDVSNYNNYSRKIINISRLESADARLVKKQHPNTELAQSPKSIPVKSLTSNEQLLIAENIKNISVKSKPENNWKMGMFVAPGYSSYTANHTPSYSQTMTSSGNSGNANVSGGLSVQYKTSNHWSIESGIYYAQNGQESNNSVNLLAINRKTDNMFAPGDVTYVSNSVRVENNNLAMNSTAGVIAFSTTPKGAELSRDFDASKTEISDLMVPEGQFSQVFEFMEIPLYVRYRVVDSKVGVELLTGLNAGIVVGNNAYIDNQYGLQNIGQTQDISPVNLSGTLGVGVNYALGEHFSVAVEPRFNYYLNSINTNSAVDFRPYRIGFYTGISYEF